MAFSAYFHWQDLLLGSHLDFPEFILMAVSFRFIHNLEAAIKDKEGCSSSLGKIWWGGGWQAVLKELLRVCG